jgi:hypothetical protein
LKVKNPLILQKISSHKDINTLSKRYFDLDMDTLRSIIEANDDGGDSVLQAVNILQNELGKDKAKEVLIAINGFKISDKNDPAKEIRDWRRSILGANG